MYNYNFINNNKEEIVVFIHAFGGSHKVYNKQIEDFSKNFNLLFIDLNGHGLSKDKSFHKQEEQSFDYICQEIIKTLDALKIKKAHFVGLSLGTMVIAVLSKKFPERIASYISLGDITKQSLKIKILCPIGWYSRFIMSYKLTYMFFAYLMIPGKNHKISRSFLIREALTLGNKEFFAWFYVLKNFYKEHKPEDFINKVPTSYIIGSEDHMFLKTTKELAILNKYSEIHILNGGGHLINIDNPNEVNQLAIKFINKNTIK